jgi:hypothetical protein
MVEAKSGETKKNKLKDFLGNNTNKLTGEIPTVFGRSNSVAISSID